MGLAEFVSNLKVSHAEEIKKLELETELKQQIKEKRKEINSYFEEYFAVNKDKFEELKVIYPTSHASVCTNDYGPYIKFSKKNNWSSNNESCAIMRCEIEKNGFEVKLKFHYTVFRKDKSDVKNNKDNYTEVVLSLKLNESKQVIMEAIDKTVVAMLEEYLIEK